MLKVEVPILEEPHVVEADVDVISDSGLKLFGRTIPVLSSCEDENEMESAADRRGEEASTLRDTEEMSSQVKNEYCAKYDSSFSSYQTTIRWFLVLITSFVFLRMIFAYYKQKQIAEGLDENGAYPRLADERGSPSGSDTGCEVVKQEENLSSQASGDGGSAPTDAKEDLDTHTVQQGATPRKSNQPAIPCPRCESLETKFCYFNNYNINQPRHFCKRCQRYWTAGGSLRNVPVGAGRRKSKSQQNNSRAHMPVRSLAMRSDPPDAAHQPIQTPIFLSPPTFPASYPLTPAKAGVSSSPASSILSAEGKSTSSMSYAATQHSVMQPSSFMISNLTNDLEMNPVDESQCGSSASTPSKPSSSFEGTDPTDDQPASVMWPNSVYPWAVFPWAWPPASFNKIAAAAFSSTASYPGSKNLINSVAMPPYCAPWTVPPALPWCPPSWASILSNNPPWGGSIATAAAAKCTSDSTEQSTCLGKHPLERSVQEEGRIGSCLWAPKGLRIEDQGGAAGISFLKSLGLSSSCDQSKGGVGMKESGDDDACVGRYHINPAASNRSAAFQESN